MNGTGSVTITMLMDSARKIVKKRYSGINLAGNFKFNLHLILVSFDFTCLKEVRVKEGWIDDWWILMEPNFRQEVIAMYQGYEAWTRKKDVIRGITV